MPARGHTHKISEDPNIIQYDAQKRCTFFVRNIEDSSLKCIISSMNETMDAAMTRTREMDPHTPKTPTASAWMALINDAPLDESKNISSANAAPPSHHKHWGSGLWSLLIAENPSDELEASNAININKADSLGRGDVNTTASPASSWGIGATNSPDKKASFLQLLQCGSLDTSTFQKIEEEINQRLENVESPCKSMSKPTATVVDVIDDQLYEMSSESEISASGRQNAPEEASVDNNNMYIELQESISFLRERNEVFNASSKYKDILLSTATSEGEQQSPKSNSTKMEDEVMPLTTRKFPIENSIDQLSHSAPEAPLSPTFGDLRKVSPFRKLQGSPTKTMKTARTENTTKNSETTFSELIVDKVDGPLIGTMPGLIIDAVGDDAIMKRVSTLTTEGECSATQLGSNKILLPLQETKTCMPPMLMKKLTMLKHIKHSSSQSTSHSIKTAAFRALNLDSTKEYTDNREAKDFIYEYESRNHAYIAFFRRGTKAVRSIRLYEHPIPSVFPTLAQEVVVKVEASTVSATDLQIRRGDFWGENSKHALNLPIVPGVAFAGKVYQMNQSSYRTGLNVGDRVISLVQVGANSRHLCISSKHLVKVPDELNDPCAVACIPEIYLTAFQALHLGQKNVARYRKTSLTGKCILVLGGATALGNALIEVALAAGCGMIYATGKEKQFDSITQAGGAPLGRDPCHWRSILTLKVDILVGIDSSVGKSELKEEHMGLIARNGRVIMLCGPDHAVETPLDLDELADLSKTGRRLYHYNVFDAWDADLKQCKRDLTHLLKLLVDGSIKPKILERIPLNRVAKAQDLMDGRKVNGFIICEPWIKGKKRRELADIAVYAESASKSTAAWDNDDTIEDRKDPSDMQIVTKVFVDPNAPQEI